MVNTDFIFSFDICCELFWWWIILFGFKKKENFPIIWEIMVYYTNGILVINSYSKSSGRFLDPSSFFHYKVIRVSKRCEMGSSRLFYSFLRRVRLYFPNFISSQWKHLIEKFTKQIDCDHSTTPFIYLFFSVYAYTSDYYSGGMLLISSHYITDLGKV